MHLWRVVRSWTERIFGEDRVKVEQREKGQVVTIDESDIETVSSLKTLLADVYTRVKFSKAFVRSFYTKPSARLDLALKAKPCGQPKLVGAWFDTLLKVYLPLNSRFGYSKNDLKQLVQKIGPKDWVPRWRLVSSSFILKDGQVDHGKVFNRSSGWRGSNLDEVFERVKTFAEITKKDTEYLSAAWQKSNLGDGTPEFFDADSLSDLIHLIDLIDDDVLYFNYLYMAHQFVGGKPIDLILDDVLVDIKTTASASLNLQYFDQLVEYYIFFRLWQEIYPFSIPLLRDYQIKELGLYFSRFGYLYRVPVAKVIKLKELDEFLKRQV